jgi:uncharacterized protein
MRKVRIISIISIFLFSLISTSLLAQTRMMVDVSGLKEVFPVTTNKKVYQEARSNKNELQMTFSGLFLFYKSFISSQDAVSCVFIPSCSEHALISVKQKGLIKGSLNAVDRLTRCHPMAMGRYVFDPNTGLLIDPVK